MFRRMALATVTALAVLLPAATAAAAAAPADKLTIIAEWTQPTRESFDAWNAARLDQAAWAAYDFDWTTDNCTLSPDKPLGFDFTLPCRHHDWGYAQYKRADQFPANKARIDTMFYGDMKRVCAKQSTLVRGACYSVAWIYYQAVSIFGSLYHVEKSDLDRVKKQLNEA